MALESPSERVDPRALILLFARVGATAFGGGVTAHLMQAFVARGWLSKASYLEALNWCQNLPGPNATNLSAYLGFRVDGARGALLATLALVTPGALTVLAAAHLIAWLPPLVARGALAAVAAAAVGLLVGMVWQLLPALGGPWRLLAAGAVFALVAVLRVPTPIAIAVMLPVLWRGRLKTP